MSDLVEIRKALQDIRDSSITTANDVKWIKDGMARGAARMDGHDTAISGLNGRVSRMQGSSGVYGGFAGALFAGLIAYFTRGHT